MYFAELQKKAEEILQSLGNGHSTVESRVKHNLEQQQKKETFIPR